MGREERLRGRTEGLTATHPDAARIQAYGTRVDGSPKGPGFFGEIARTDEPEMFSTELSTSVTVDGVRLLFPLLVPSLTAEEIAHLVDGGAPTRAIAEKAYAHAQQRRAAGQSPFADVGDQVTLPASAAQALADGYRTP